MNTDASRREALIRRYFAAWLHNDPACLREVFSSDAVYSECYGPEYRGLSQIQKWFADWNRRGRVLRWDVRGFLHDGPHTAVQWYFQCEYGGEVSGFDGVTLADFDGDGKIVRLREFQSKAEHCFPYGKETV